MIPLLILLPILMLHEDSLGAQTELAELNWSGIQDRAWVGQDFFANRLQDWEVRDEALQLTDSVLRRDAFRTISCLTHSFGHSESIRLSMRFSYPRRSSEEETPPVIGFVFGTGSLDRDFRASALVHHAPGEGAGYFLGVNEAGSLVSWDRNVTSSTPDRWSEPLKNPSVVEEGELDSKLVVSFQNAESNNDVRTTLALFHGGSAKPSSVKELSISRQDLLGSFAIAMDHGSKSLARFTIKSLTLEGMDPHPERSFGPVLGTQYTLSRGVMKMTAQLAPVAMTENSQALLAVDSGQGFETIGQAQVVVPGWTATFRVDDWDSSKEVSYRVTYDEGSWEGIIRREPLDSETLVVAAFTGNHNGARGVESREFNWNDDIWFPHENVVDAVRFHNPDLLFFSGDQIYEGASPTRADRANIELDYLYKWSLWVWAFRDIAKDRPCLCIPDDHDVYQGNVWGEGGRHTDKDDRGGYVHPASFVKMVERTQTSHFPDPYDSTPVEQGIGVYYTSLLYGEIDFAILEDRKFKSGCNGRVPDSGSSRADHISDPEFDIAKADVPGAKLLGQRQLDFLEHWASHWKGAVMKVALSQTVFANVATHHGPGLTYLRADLDSNGWPQSGRRRALEVLRKASAFHLCGDQHLATIVHHGLDEFDDAPFSFVVPSIANFYPRAFAPMNHGAYEKPNLEDCTGRHLDGLGNRVNVYAVTNPEKHLPKSIDDGMPGFGIVRFNKSLRQIEMECWPRRTDPRGSNAKQYPGWPLTISQSDNDQRRALGWLPTFALPEATSAVFKVYRDQELISAMRVQAHRHRPKVFEPGIYSVVIEVPEVNKSFRVDELSPKDIADLTTIDVELSTDQ